MPIFSITRVILRAGSRLISLVALAELINELRDLAEAEGIEQWGRIWGQIAV